MDEIDQLNTRNADLLKRIEGWETTYRHRKPCEEYRKTGFCMHMLNAQNKKFGKESKQLFSELAGMGVR